MSQQRPAWGHQPQQPQWGPPPPPKRSNTGRNIGLGCAGLFGALAICGVFIIVLGGDPADSGSNSDKPTKASKPADKSKLDTEGNLACDDFAGDYESAQTQQARINLADKVNKWAPKSGTDRIAYSAKVLANGAEGSDGAWQIAADTFAQACLDAGWKA